MRAKCIELAFPSGESHTIPLEGYLIDGKMTGKVTLKALPVAFTYQVTFEDEPPTCQPSEVPDAKVLTVLLEEVRTLIAEQQYAAANIIIKSMGRMLHA